MKPQVTAELSHVERRWRRKEWMMRLIVSHRLSPTSLTPSSINSLIQDLWHISFNVKLQALSENVYFVAEISNFISSVHSAMSASWAFTAQKMARKVYPMEETDSNRVYQRELKNVMNQIQIARTKKSTSQNSLESFVPCICCEI